MTALGDIGPHHPARWAALRADTAAVTVRDAAGPDGVIDAVTYGQLAERSAQLARALRRRGLHTGDGVVTVCSNRAELIVTAWAALRSGLHRVTMVQLVPTMLARMLRLDRATGDRFDRSSLRVVLHAAAPCPRHVKEAAIEWLGPIVHEYYSGTEGSGITYITAEEWLAHPGSVGRPILGAVHVADDDGRPLPAFRDGLVWFDAGGDRYDYHGDAEATAARRHRLGWTTLDDIGHVDDEGYVYLTDRRGNMIVSGGVNISPREVEDVLSTHPAVDDVAVIGVPSRDLGEEVKAVVVVRADAVVDPIALPGELIGHCRDVLAPFKCPRSVDLVDALPRLPTGKLATRLFRDHYWDGHGTRIV